MVHLERNVRGFMLKVETHDRPHLDEIAALWLIERFASDNWLSSHYPFVHVTLGVGGSEFDEHPRNGSSPTPEDCCATLVAKSLGIEEDPALAQLLKFIVNVDIKGAGHPFDLYNLVKFLNDEHPDDPQWVVDWTFAALDAKYAEQREFLVSREAVRSIPVVVSLTGDPSLGLLVIESDRGAIAKAAAELYGNRYGACIVRRSTGHVQVFTNKRAHLTLSHVVRLLRIAELRKVAESRRRRSVTDLEDDALSCPGFLEGVPQWYYHANGEQLLNGSKTADAPATTLDLTTIVDCVVLGISRALPKPKPGIPSPAPNVPTLRV